MIFNFFMLFALPTAGTLGNDLQVRVGFPTKLGINSGQMITEVNGGRHDVTRGSTVIPPAIAVGQVKNSLGGGHGADSSLEGLLDVNPYEVLRHIVLLLVTPMTSVQE